MTISMCISYVEGDELAVILNIRYTLSSLIITNLSHAKTKSEHLSMFVSFICVTGLRDQCCKQDIYSISSSMVG